MINLLFDSSYKTPNFFTLSYLKPLMCNIL